MAAASKPKDSSKRRLVHLVIDEVDKPKDFGELSLEKRSVIRFAWHLDRSNLEAFTVMIIFEIHRVVIGKERQSVR